MIEVSNETVIAYEPETTITYREPPHFDKTLVMYGLVIAAFSLLFWFRVRTLFALKRECTETVSAVVTRIEKNNPAYSPFRTRYAQYNATYRYEYNGITYDGNNRIASGKRPCAIGETVLIRINPDNPERLFDGYAASALSITLTYAVLLISLSLFMIFGPFIIR